MVPAYFSELVKALVATNDATAVQSAFNVVKNVAKPTLQDFVRSATMTKNPKAVEAVFKAFKNKGIISKASGILSTGALHMLGPVVLPKEALSKLESLRSNQTKIKG